MIHAVFDFGEMTAHQMMVPRTEMITLDVDTPIGEVCDFAAQHHHNKYPVYENDLDHIVGILHVKDLVPAMRLPPDRQPALRQLMREPLFVPDTIGVNDLLARFRQRKQHIAILLDEYGGTAGIVTLQDIMDELVGEVSDVFGPDEPEVQKLPDGRVRLDGLMLLDRLQRSVRGRSERSELRNHRRLHDGPARSHSQSGRRSGCAGERSRSAAPARGCDGRQAHRVDRDVARYPEQVRDVTLGQ